jgi:DNA-binding CsgD family transcriptional regulator
MTSGLPALTDKEKQTLRLLLGGYDAKSMARYLNLSVHTINERLRDARRKLGTSSSREAARLLGEAEAPSPSTIPELFGDKRLGAAPAAMIEQIEPARTVHRAVWIIGGIAVMSFALALFALAAPAQQAATPAAPAAASETAGAEAAWAWLMLVDASNWQASWAATGSSFRAANTVGNWEGASQTARVPLGAVRARVLESDVLAPTPPAGNRVVRFKTVFANKADAVETIALVYEDRAWKVVGYFID